MGAALEEANKAEEDATEAAERSAGDSDDENPAQAASSASGMPLPIQHDEHPQDIPRIDQAVPNVRGRGLQSSRHDTQEAVTRKPPTEPTTEEIDVHKLTQLPYRDWCPWCVRARCPNRAHKRVNGWIAKDPSTMRRRVLS